MGSIVGWLGRSSRTRRTRFLAAILVSFLVFNIIDVRQVQHALEADKSHQGSLNQPRGKIFVSAIHWNNEYILRSSWNDVVVALAEALGPANVFVSVRGSGNRDNTSDALHQLDHSLQNIGVRRNVIIDKVSHEAAANKRPGPVGWVDTSRGKRERRRIPYLAALRNQTLNPMQKLEAQGEVFDRILFLGDVVFTVDDVLELLHTNAGEYAAACSQDFAHPPLFYDTFALRDSERHEHATQTWPYFRSRHSRRAIKHNQPVPVSSCWNGIVAMDASPFYGNPRLGFRAIPDGLAQAHLEGSECCLIHADNPVSGTKGVWLNPRVRVGYDDQAYQAVHRSSSSSNWLSTFDIVVGLWKNRIVRWSTTDWFKLRVVKNRLAAWRAGNPGIAEPGEFCMINEMQVLSAKGWAHV